MLWQTSQQAQVAASKKRCQGSGTGAPPSLKARPPSQRSLIRAGIRSIGQGRWPRTRAKIQLVGDRHFFVALRSIYPFCNLLGEDIVDVCFFLAKFKSFWKLLGRRLGVEGCVGPKV